MAADDPKSVRRDIRNNRLAIPQEHHSSRGGTPPRLEQFYPRFVAHEHAGADVAAKGGLPVLMWLGVFALAYLIILSITLDENNVQLICMRVLSSLWD